MHSGIFLLLRIEMAKFVITAHHPIKNDTKKLIYDTSVSSLQWENGDYISPVRSQTKQEAVGQKKLEKGKRKLSKIKIQLGLSCNYECDYCNQRFVPHAEQTNPDDVQPFVDNMSTWYEGGLNGLGANSHFEFWGGEPFVYWKTFKPLAEAIAAKYPHATMSVITNGSLLDPEKNDWLEKYNFSMAVSHDGPGQHVRGPDPLEDPVAKSAILDLFKRLAPKRKFSFNSMINSKNTSRSDIQGYFVNLIATELGEEWIQYLTIGEGTFVDAYDDGGLANSLLDEEEDVKFRNQALNDIRSGGAMKFNSIHQKITSFMYTLQSGKLSADLGQKCGMDKADNIAIDLNGNVLTCQNVSPVSVNPSGISHHLGHVSDLENVEIKTGTHWSDRAECPNCPVLHICKGACFFLTGQLWEASCNNAFSDNISIFTAAIETITGGYIPGHIEGPQRQDRKDIFWWMNGKPEITRKAKKIIPILAV